MLPPEPDQLLQALADALNTMAFIVVDPLMESPAADADTLEVTLPFSGPVNGKLYLHAPSALGALVASNILATEPDAPEAIEKAADALRELSNITAGLLLRQLCPADNTPQLGIATTTPAIGPMPPSINAALAADGFPITIGVAFNP
jgi:CheY-specific phosphatase CheX